MANRVWKVGTRRGIAYVEEREIAEQVLAATGRSPEALTAPPPRRAASATKPAAEAQLDGGAMAVYSDRKGKPFAWQIPFDVGCWDAVTAVVLPGADR
jgi:hypothetical protein